MALSTINVGDMHCASCVRKIERALADVCAIRSVHVNPARRLVVVDHGAEVEPVALLQRIEDAGFHPSLSKIDTGNRRQRDLLKRLGVAGLGMMQVMMLALPLYAGVFYGIDEGSRRLLEYTSLLFTLPVVLYSAVPFFTSARSAATDFLRGRGGLNMDVPIALAIGSAFLVSLANTLRGEGEVYYDSVTMFTFLLLTARFVDDRLKARFEDANWTLASLPAEALVVTADGSIRATALDAVPPGTRVWVEQGNQVPLDGEVTRGEATLDESALTGESVWVKRREGEAVFAGTMNHGPGFEILTTATVGTTRMAGIADLAARAQADKPAVARLADRIAGRFVPTVLVLAAVSWLGWQLVDPSQAFVAALTVLVVSCPCALSLATPAAITAAMTRLRQSGIVLTRSEALEQLDGIDAAIVDKTGTLTVHDPVLERIEWLAEDLDRDALVHAAAALERHSNHPLARAFRRAWPDAAPDTIDQVRVVSGAGVDGRWRGRRLRIGHAAFCGVGTDDERAVHLTVDGVPAARFHIADPLRPDTAAAIAGLRRAGLRVIMVSGDAPERCAALAEHLGIEYAARQAPETKLEVLRQLQREGAKVLVLGDGINDVPVLAAADVSAAVLESSDLVKANCDVLLLSRRLGALVELVHLGRRARRVIRQNLGWALAYNLTAMPLAALGFVPPWLAAIGMAGSSILVMSNAARLLKVDTRPAAAAAPPDAAPLPATS